MRQPHPNPGPGDPRPGDPRPGDPRPGDPRPGDPRPGDPRPGDPRPGGSGGSGPGDSGPAGTGPDRPAGRARPAKDTGPSVAALVNITVPLAVLSGDTGAPGEAAGFGLLDHQGTRDLAAAAARHPATRWCLTILIRNPDGTAAAHGCAPGRRQLPAAASPRNLTSPRDLLSRLNITVTPVARGP